MSVRIPLTRKLLLLSYESGWTLTEERTYKSGKQKGEKYDYTLGYYGALGSALSAALDEHLRQSDATEVSELLREIEAFKERLRKLLRVEVTFDLGKVK